VKAIVSAVCGFAPAKSLQGDRKMRFFIESLLLPSGLLFLGLALGLARSFVPLRTKLPWKKPKPSPSKARPAPRSPSESLSLSWPLPVDEEPDYYDSHERWSSDIY
jgi:hypothetical protein